jgi:hypothetical protein
MFVLLESPSPSRRIFCRLPFTPSLWFAVSILHKGQPIQGRGRVNHVSAETAQENPQVVLGMFFVNSIPASVLFDSGASHSSISAQFVAKHSIPMCHMKQTVLVKSPGGNENFIHVS